MTGNDAATPEGDSGPLPSTLPAPTLELGTTPADFSCVGERTAPTGGALIPIEITLASFGYDDYATGVRFCFCPDNVLSPEAISGTSCGGCQDVTSSMADGSATVMAQSGGWYAYRAFYTMGETLRETYVASAQVNEVAPTESGGAVEGNAVSASIVEVIVAGQGISPRVLGTATIAGVAEDCSGRAVRGAIVRAFHADGSAIIDTMRLSDPHYKYFNGTRSPNQDGMHTEGDGLFMGAYIHPVGVSEPIRVETYVNLDGVDTRVGCEVVDIFENGTSIVNVGPIRSDYPSGHPCAE